MTTDLPSEPTILIVEDDVNLRETLGMILEDEGYRTAMVSNGREALNHLRSAPPPCLILLDLTMPVMTGWEFRIEQRRDPALAEIPVVVISAVASSAERINALDAAAYFRKPLDVDALLQTIARHCGPTGPALTDR
jgi:CheY-like chemotaxis protein